MRKDVMEAVEKLTATFWPDVIVSPVKSNGATDVKYILAAGIPVFGISGIFTDMDDVRAHSKDERIGVKEFYEGNEFMYRFIKIMTSGG